MIRTDTARKSSCRGLRARSVTAGLFISLVLASCDRVDMQVEGAASALPEDRYVEVNGARLHFLDWGGDGDLLVLIPGLTLTSHTFARLAPLLSPTYRVMALTRRGHGPSDAAPATFDVDLNVDDLAAVIRTFTDRPAVVAGMSLGGLEIPRLARRYPDLVRALIFLDGVYDWNRAADWPPLVGFAADSSYPSLAALDAWHRETFAEFWDEGFRRALHAQVYMRGGGEVAWVLLPGSPAFANWVALFSQWDRADYEAIGVPVLAIRAFQEGYLTANLTRRGFSAEDVQRARMWAREFDDVMKAEGLKLLTEANPTAQIVELLDTHHMLHAHRPERVAEIMLSFLSSLGSGN